MKNTKEIGSFAFVLFKTSRFLARAFQKRLAHVAAHPTATAHCPDRARGLDCTAWPGKQTARAARFVPLAKHTINPHKKNKAALLTLAHISRVAVAQHERDRRAHTARDERGQKNNTDFEREDPKLLASQLLLAPRRLAEIVRAHVQPLHLAGNCSGSRLHTEHGLDVRAHVFALRNALIPIEDPPKDDKESSNITHSLEAKNAFGCRVEIFGVEANRSASRITLRKTS